ncbi:MAG: hypothetical protein OEV36_10770 [Myxococcales bacterium]|nr:hypothetical protein [Myxococcales bacterium]
MKHYTTLMLAAAVATAIGCEKSKLQEDVMDDSTWETSTGEERREKPPAEPKPESSLQKPFPRVSTGVIARNDLLPVLDGGLGRFLQNVTLEPAFHQGAFVGFRIVSLFPGEPAFASLDLRPGDTVTRINGRPIERPEQAAAVWEDLRAASNLVVSYRRDGEERALRFRIVDES